MNRVQIKAIKLRAGSWEVGLAGGLHDLDSPVPTDPGHNQDLSPQK